MMGGIEQGIHYTVFKEDIEDANTQDVTKKEGTAKSYGESEDEKLVLEQSVLSD